MSRPHTHLVFVCIFAGAPFLAACQDLPELIYETEHLHIGTSFEQPLCQGDLDYLEGVVTSLESRLDTTIAGPIEVYLWDEHQLRNPGWCDSDEQPGCYDGSRVYSNESALDHELVHAVVDSFADPPKFWSEGAAEALVSTRTLLTTSTPSSHIDAEEPSYAVAGHFSRWVLETYGEQSYRALLRHPGDGRQAFEETYDLSIEDAEALYFDEAPHSYGALISCQYPDLPSVGELSWSEQIDINCALPHVYGGTFGLKAKRVLTISERGAYSISTTAEGGVLMRCQDETYSAPPSLEDSEIYGDAPAYTLMYINKYMIPLPGGGEPMVLDLTPGRYELLVGYPSYEPRQARVDVIAVPARAP